MFDLFNQISNIVIGPLMTLANGLKHLPLLFAFFLGLVGAVAPCQLTSNISAITIYGNKSLVDRVPWFHVWLFILGKIVVYSGLGLIIWILGKEIYALFSEVMPIIRKAIGPLLIIIGLFMLGVFSKLRHLPSFKMPITVFKDNYLGSFLMGISFTLAFCPTMFVLFILTLMPIVLSSPYGFVLPSVFGIGTSLPLILVIFLIWYFGASGAILKRGRKLGTYVQKIAGVILILIGFLDTLTYWSY